MPGGHRLAPTEAAAETADSNPVASIFSFIYAGFLTEARFLLLVAAGCRSQKALRDGSSRRLFLPEKARPAGRFPARFARRLPGVSFLLPFCYEWAEIPFRKYFPSLNLY